LNPSHPTAFSGVGRIKRFYNISQKKAEEFLTGVNSYTLHREYKKPKKRNPFYSYRLREHLQADLIDIQQLARFNSGYRYIVCVIDLFSRKLFVQLIKKKTALETATVLRIIFDEMGGNIGTLLCDKGAELKNSIVKKLLREKNIKLLHPASEIKAGVVERVNRTLQNLIYRYMTENETRKYFDVIQDLVSSYNNRGHRTLKYLTPNEAEMEENQEKVLDALNTHYTKHVSGTNKKTKFKLNDLVRIKKESGKFARGYEEQFTRETFRIHSIRKRMPVIMFILKSVDKDDIIKGGFYSNELQKVKEGDIYKIEKVMRRRTRNGQKEIYVKWLDFDSTHNSWIKHTDVTKVYRKK
jgi:hypothetical protein